jgi:RNA polymerase sigma-70 factor (ECF subfamily)
LIDPRCEPSAQPEDTLLKDLPEADKSTPGIQEQIPAPLRGSSVPPVRAGSEEPAKLETLYEKWSRFVWLTLQRLGVRRADLDDVCHDVFVVVHRKLPEFDQNAKVHAWLFGICARVAANYRRRAYIRLEHSNGEVEDVAPAASQSGQLPDDALAQRQAMDLAESILSRMSPVKRAVFVMFELEGLGCPEIAQELGLPVGTVYSRLHAARKFFAEAARKAATSSRAAP